MSKSVQETNKCSLAQNTGLDDVKAESSNIDAKVCSCSQTLNRKTEGFSDIIITPVTDEDDLRKFITFTHKIYEGNPFWPGQIDENELAFFDQANNYSLRYLEIKNFLAYKNGEVVGRISASINELHNQHWNQNIGFFGHFECINDQKVANALLATAEKWVKERGKEEIYGPFSYTYYDVIGVVLEGHNARPTAGLAFTPPYYLDLIADAGYYPIRDVVEVLATVEKHYNILQEKLPEVQHLVEDLDYRIRCIDESRFDEELLKVRQLHCESFSSHWGSRPLDTEEWLAVLKATYPYMPQELFLIAEHHGEPIAFLFHMDDTNEEIYSIYHKTPHSKKRIKAYVIGVKHEYRKHGLGKWLSIKAAEKMKEMNYEEISFSYIDSQNTKSINLSTGMGGHIDKIYRVFSKKL